MFAGILKYCNSVYLSGSRTVMHALQMTVSASGEKVILSENIQLKILLDI